MLETSCVVYLLQVPINLISQMRFYQVLIFILFALVSCENIPSEDVFEYSHEGETQDSVNPLLKASINAKLKITISDEDDCAYFIYKFQRPMHDFSNPQSLSGEEYSKAESMFYNGIIPDKFVFVMEGKEGKIIQGFSIESKSNKSASIIFVKDAFKSTFPVLFKGKLLENNKLISAKTMRAKLEMTERGIIKIARYSPSERKVIYD